MKSRAESLEAELSGRAMTREEGLWFRQEGAAGASIMHASAVTDAGRGLHGVTAFVFAENHKFEQKVMAPRADFSDHRWIFTNAEIVSARDAPRRLVDYELPTDLTAETLAQTVAEPAAVSIWSLPGFVDAAYRTGLAPNRYRVALHELLSRPLFLLAMVLVAASVTLRPTRSGGAWQLMLTGVAAGFLLYFFREIAGDLGANGIINPVLAAWLPPIAALTFGATALLHQEDG
jgi:lipopolysaccharide export system permease protein